ncbi:OLC1v1019990C1 [Oldenlandia corymbosa var. corymbosa]|uniref:OLC1v1019990C1 n=1 Tax=Oldenlandia corymbosa var. corymbosa TaxID=529605 RepID=A0AAV1EFL2_OLDCO|nr:OLC1v1019990C1 [Oldenlandia corymbosa var. corymbosa]
MAIKLVIITFLLFALTVAGARTKSPPSRNGTFSPPPPPPRNGSVSPPPPPRNATVPPPPPVAAGAPTNCSDELVVFSNCLSYISSSPNNTTAVPSRHCCHDVASAYLSGTAVCFCYLVQKPNLLGFPVNFTKILSLSTRCPVVDHGTKANFSIKALCSGIHTLPPLSSITISDRPKPRISGPVPPTPTIPHISGPVNHSPPPPGMNLTQESTAASGTQGHADNQSDVSNQSQQADHEAHPAPTFQVFPAWRTFSINKADANPAGFPLSWCLFGHVVASIFTALSVAY